MIAAAWTYGDPSIGYHDPACPCPRHCGNCLEDLDRIRGDQRKLALTGRLCGIVLPLRARYCSPYCQGVAKRDRALDRRITANCTAAMRSQP